MIVTTATDWTGKPEEVTVSTGESVDWNAGATISAAPVHRRIRKPLSGNPYGCRACTRRKVMQSKVSASEWEQHHRRMVDAARAVNVVSSEWRRLRHLCQCAKRRCTALADAAYKNYGGRGITFEFPSASAMAQWVLDNLGPRPVWGRWTALTTTPGTLQATCGGQRRRTNRGTDEGISGAYTGTVYKTLRYYARTCRMKRSEHGLRKG